MHNWPNGFWQGPASANGVGQAATFGSVCNGLGSVTVRKTNSKDDELTTNCQTPIKYIKLLYWIRTGVRIRITWWLKDGNRADITVMIHNWISKFQSPEIHGSSKYNAQCLICAIPQWVKHDTSGWQQWGLYFSHMFAGRTPALAYSPRCHILRQMCFLSHRVWKAWESVKLRFLPADRMDQCAKISHRLALKALATCATFL